MLGDENKVNISKMEILKDVLSTFFYVLLLDQVVFKYTSTEITGENPHLVDHLSGLDSFLRNERLSARSARKRVEHPLPRSACARRENLVVYT